MTVNPEHLSWAANIGVIVSLVFQERGWLYLSFPVGLLVSLIYLCYGLALRDHSFLYSNLFVFIPFNIYGSYKWIKKHYNHEVFNA